MVDHRRARGARPALRIPRVEPTKRNEPQFVTVPTFGESTTEARAHASSSRIWACARASKAGHRFVEARRHVHQTGPGGRQSVQKGSTVNV